MKRIFALILIFMMITGCAAQQHYTIPTDKTKTDFLFDREDCASTTGWRGGSFLIGPLIIILPIAIGIAIYRINQQKNFELCMVGKGYKCTEGCWNETPSQPIPKSEEMQPQKERKQVP